MRYADIIVDISHESLDKTYQYRIPEECEEQAVIGAYVYVPFGNRSIHGYIVDITTKPKIDEAKIKPILRVENAPAIESQMIFLAYRIKECFGGTMNEALKTVIPVKKNVKRKEDRTIISCQTKEETKRCMEECLKKSHHAKAKLLALLLDQDKLNYEEVIGKYKISKSTIDSLIKQGQIQIDAKERYRNPVISLDRPKKHVELTKEQSYIVDSVMEEYNEGIRNTYLIHGVTGSGKTEVYMELIEKVIAQGKQVIVLIPEIALTYQTVTRFYERFSDRVSIMNSRMSAGERYDQSERAKQGDIDIMIGPRSVLFTPFNRLGLIIIDEEHEGSYKSETTPKYHAVTVAIERAKIADASVILGSATPSLESYDRAVKGEYRLFTLKNRTGNATLPMVEIVDLREELKKKNRSIFSERLRELMTDRLQKREQMMLFINRRGYAGFVSCRSCGYVLKCPHCDVSLTSHHDGRLICHYCGYEESMPKTCPSCSSKYIAAFGTGTQKVEEFVRREFPSARVLRMDMDTTKNKGGHEAILSAFAKHEADILIGTQMIVKGHDFPKVSLVGVIAADLSLYAGDFRASERTFDLLCQAAGRAGRGDIPGNVVIQTYHPEHYSIITAAKQDYESFYEAEIAYRTLMMYPPAAHMLLLLVFSKEEDKVIQGAELLGKLLKEAKEEEQDDELVIIGPAPASLSKANDLYRQVIYLKHESYEVLVDRKNFLEGYLSYTDKLSGCNVQFDFNPMNGY